MTTFTTKDFPPDFVAVAPDPPDWADVGTMRLLPVRWEGLVVVYAARYAGIRQVGVGYESQG